MSTTLSQRNNGSIDHTYLQASASLITAYQTTTPQKVNQPLGGGGVAGGTHMPSNGRYQLAGGSQCLAPTPSHEDDDFVQLRSEHKASHRSISPSQPVPAMNAHETSQQSDQSSADLWTALYDYEAQNEDELTLSRGTVVLVLSKDSAISGDVGWWTGKIGDKVGIFPCNYVTDRDMLMVDELRESIGDVQPIEIEHKDLVVKEVIGQGGFNKVRRGFWRGQEVAVKTQCQGGSHEKIRENVLKEAKLCWTLSHKNIVALLGVCLQQHFSLVMEYARGGPLNQILASYKIPPDVLVGWAIQIAEGMDYLHTGAPISIIHRDLKSSNSKCAILLCVCVCVFFLCLFHYRLRSATECPA